MLLTMKNNHVFVCGITQSGKSYFVKKALEELPGAVLYMNIQDEDVPARFVPVYADAVDYAFLRDLLAKGLKIDLRFSDANKAYTFVAGYVLNRLLSDTFTPSRPVYVAVDECHILRGYSLLAAKNAATMGLKKGLRCVFITQRPANCDKTLYTQASEQYIFYCAPSEKAYFKSKGVDYDDCVALWGDPHAHNYIFYDGYELTPRPAIK